MSRVSQLIDEVLELANRKDASMRGRVLHALDRAVTHWAERRPWEGLKRWEDFAASGTRYMVLPERVRKILSVSDATNHLDIDAGAHWSRTAMIPWSQTTAAATPYEWRDLGIVPVTSDPSTLSPLELEASVSEVDTITIRGLTFDTNSSGTTMQYFPVTEVFTLGGTGATDTQSSFVTVDTIERGLATGSADITIRDSQNGNVISRIEAGERGPSFQRIEFLYVPAAGNLVRIEYYAKPKRLTSEASTAPPDVDHDFLVWTALGDLHHLLNEGQAALTAWQKANGLMDEKRISELTQGEKTIQFQPDAFYIRMEGPELDGYGFQ